MESAAAFPASSAKWRESELRTIRHRNKHDKPRHDRDEFQNIPLCQSLRGKSREFAAPESWTECHQFTGMKQLLYLYLNAEMYMKRFSTIHVLFQISATIKLNCGDYDSYEYQGQLTSPSIKVEMEEFSDLGDLLPALKEKSVMDDLSFAKDGYGEITECTIPSYESLNLGDFAEKDTGKCDNNQLYIDNKHINLENLEDELFFLQQELSSGCETSELNKRLSTSNNNYLKKEPSDIFNFTKSKMNVCNVDHQYSRIPSPLNNTLLPQHSPAPVQVYANHEINQKKGSGLGLDLKSLMGDVLNTPDILESVVSLENEGFNFIARIGEKKLPKTECDSEIPFFSRTDDSLISIPSESEIITKPSRKRRKYSDDEDYEPPVNVRKRKKTLEFFESDSESDEDFVPTKTLKGRSTRISSVSSDSSKDSRVSKYRELRDKNNEASRKSRLKRKVKEQEMESEAYKLETRNVKLKTKVQELQRMVDNLRSNLFQLMMKK